MIESLLVIVAVALLVAGVLMMLSPQGLEPLERILNQPVGERALLSLRTGIRGEQAIEEVLNRPVLMWATYWDRWIRRKPRAAGALLLAAGVLCIAAAAG